MSRTKKIILVAILLTLLIVLSRFFSIKTPIFKISLGFVPTMLCATWLGPKWTVLLNVLGDIIGATIFPTGPYFIGYTISTAIAGLIYGLLLYQKSLDLFTDKKLVIRTTISVLLITVFINLGLNTLWTSITSGKAFMVLIVTRLINQLIMIPIHIIIFIFIERMLRNPFNKYIRSSND